MKLLWSERRFSVPYLKMNKGDTQRNHTKKSHLLIEKTMYSFFSGLDRLRWSPHCWSIRQSRSRLLFPALMWTAALLSRYLSNIRADTDVYPWGNKDFSIDEILISLRPYYSLLSNNVVFLGAKRPLLITLFVRLSNAQCLLLLIQLSKNKRQFSCFAIFFNVQAFVVLARTHKHILGDKDEEEELVEDLQVVQLIITKLWDFFMKSP